MTDCYVETSRSGHGGRTSGAAELTYSEMLSRAVYRFVVWAEHTHRVRAERRRAMAALHTLEGFDDRRLAEMGLSRAELAAEALATAEAKRDRAAAAAGLTS